jgi:hypothetical protein
MDLAEAREGGLAQASRHPWERARLALAMRLIRQHAVPADGDVVLDIGCGDTFVVESLALAFPGARFHAVDSAFTPELMAAFGRRMKASNITLFSSIDDVPREKPASLILLMDVLEHVPDDRGMLGSLVRGPLAGRGTAFLLTVPAYPLLFSAHDRFLGHYRRYSSSAFDALIASAGLVPLVIGHFFTSLVPLRLARLAAERLGAGSAEPTSDLAAWHGSERLARGLARLLEWDGRVALALLARGIRLPGLSNFAICRTSA